MKKIFILIFLIFIFTFLFTNIALANGDTFRVEDFIKLYTQPRRFCKTFVIEPGFILVVDEYFSHESFMKVYVKDLDEEGYIIKDDLFDDSLTTEVSDDIVDSGENVTASARGSMSRSGGFSFRTIDISTYGNKKGLDFIERNSTNVFMIDQMLEEWEKFREEGGLGEFYENEEEEISD